MAILLKSLEPSARMPNSDFTLGIIHVPVCMVSSYFPNTRPPPVKPLLGSFNFFISDDTTSVWSSSQMLSVISKYNSVFPLLIHPYSTVSFHFDMWRCENLTNFQAVLHSRLHHYFIQQQDTEDSEYVFSREQVHCCVQYSSRNAISINVTE